MSGKKKENGKGILSALKSGTKYEHMESFLATLEIPDSSPPPWVVPVPL